MAHYLTITQSLVLFHAGFLQPAVCRSLEIKKKEPIKHTSLNTACATPHATLGQNQMANGLNFFRT